MVILVTGATGFVGKRVCNMLLQNNHKIRIISRTPSTEFDDVIVSDLSVDPINKNIFDNVSTVIHLAGYAHDVKSKGNKEDYLKLNVQASKKLAEIAKNCGVSSFIYLSSTKAGPNNDFISSEKEAEGLKSKHLQITLENITYDHCLEVLELKEEPSEHYYCYNEKQQILDHLVIIGNNYVEKIDSL